MNLKLCNHKTDPNGQYTLSKGQYYSLFTIYSQLYNEAESNEQSKTESRNTCTLCEIEHQLSQGKEQITVKNQEEALELLNEQLQINNQNHFQWYLKGNVLANLTRYEEAIQSYDKALQIETKNDTYYYKKGI